MTVILIVIYTAIVNQPTIYTWEFDNLRSCEQTAEFITQNETDVVAQCVENGKGV